MSQQRAVSNQGSRRSSSRVTALPKRAARGPVERGRTTAHSAAIKISSQEISNELARVLGRQLLGTIVDKGGRTLQRWISGSSQPGSDDERVLRDCYQVYRIVCSVEDERTVRAWFMGMNPLLDDEAPAEALASLRSKEVMAAARTFLAAT